jgi:hypothetical protein
MRGDLRLSLDLADPEGTAWAQATVADRHYLHAPVDVRGRPLAYLVVMPDGERVGCLIFARPEATRVNGWFGSVEDVCRGRCPLTRWELINLARVWLDPRIQREGIWEVKNAATRMIAEALRRIPIDYLLARPPVWTEERFALAECLSYCDTTVHRGALYRAASFRLVRANTRGLQTFARRLRALTPSERSLVLAASKTDPRACRLRAERKAAETQQYLFAC